MGESFFNTIIPKTSFVHLHWWHVVMWAIGFAFTYLAIKKDFEPLLLVPIGFRILTVNLSITPLMGISEGEDQPPYWVGRCFRRPHGREGLPKSGQHPNPTSFLLMHAMGPNVAGVIGTAIVAGLFLSILT